MNVIRVSYSLDPDLNHSVQGDYLSDCDDAQVSLRLADSSFCWFCMCVCGGFLP